MRFLRRSLASVSVTTEIFAFAMSKPRGEKKNHDSLADPRLVCRPFRVAQQIARTISTVQPGRTITNSFSDIFAEQTGFDYMYIYVST